MRDLTEQDLKDLGVLLGHRRKMLRAIAELDRGSLAPAEPATEPVAPVRHGTPQALSPQCFFWCARVRSRRDGARCAQSRHEP